MAKRVFGKNHPNLLTSLNDLGISFIKIKDFEKALIYL